MTAIICILHIQYSASGLDRKLCVINARICLNQSYSFAKEFEIMFSTTSVSCSFSVLCLLLSVPGLGKRTPRTPAVLSRLSPTIRKTVKIKGRGEEERKNKTTTTTMQSFYSRPLILYQSHQMWLYSTPGSSSTKHDVNWVFASLFLSRFAGFSNLGTHTLECSLDMFLETKNHT